MRRENKRVEKNKVHNPSLFISFYNDERENKQVAQGNHKTEDFRVSNDDAAVAQRRLEDKQLEEMTNTDRLVKEQEKVHLGKKVRANIMVTGVHGQEGTEGNVAEKKRVKESMKANIGKLLKYNSWSTRWSLIRGFNTRKRCSVSVMFKCYS
uniref:Zinc finger, CCHC-type n=1 Tax=Tanacetum cinerariifolium TaxID=118510 RepID=A0A6L2MRB2_TANCI|nr:zinc finger, CCHC-type [Tanacetum cinerariifolium]